MSQESVPPLEPRLSARRYCDQPFPRYRFIPGQFPHPTAHPDGHSYGAAHAAVFVPPERWAESVDYLYGCDLYNHAFWWEAHESWEGLWQLTDKKAPQGRFLQGLIQVAACHLKLHVRHPRGVERLCRTSAEHLVASMTGSAGDPFMGLKVRTWLADVQAYYETVTGRQEPAHDPEHYPYIILAE